MHAGEVPAGKCFQAAQACACPIPRINLPPDSLVAPIRDPRSRGLGRRSHASSARFEPVRPASPLTRCFSGMRKRWSPRCRPPAAGVPALSGRGRCRDECARRRSQPVPGADRLGGNSSQRAVKRRTTLQGAGRRLELSSKHEIIGLLTGQEPGIATVWASGSHLRHGAPKSQIRLLNVEAIESNEGRRGSNPNNAVSGSTAEC